MTLVGTSASNVDLTGARVLIVEDEFMIADYARELVLEAGAAEVLLAVNIAQASAHLAAGKIDVAVVDVNLGPESGYPLALELKNQGVPFAFASGYGRDLPGADGFAGVPSIPKPYTGEMIVSVLAGLIARTGA